jgi:hypothetical protein
MNTDDYLAAYEKETNRYLENKTTEKIEKEIKESLGILPYHKTLKGYRFVDEIPMLHIGKYTRWINKLDDGASGGASPITSGGFLTVIDYTNNGILLTIKTWQNKYIKILFDECLIYQKLTPGEKLVLSVADYLDK